VKENVGWVGDGKWKLGEKEKKKKRKKMREEWKSRVCGVR
jgi:hypothetical protein